MTSWAMLSTWDSESIVHAVKSDGIVVLDRFFGQNELTTLNGEFSALFKGENVEGTKRHQKTEYLDAKHLMPERLDRKKFPALSGLTDDTVLRKAAEDYFRKPIIYPQKIFATWSAGTERPVQALPFVLHTDRFHMFKYMIYLHDVNAASGAMVAAPGRHRELAQKRLDWLASGRPYEKRPNILDDIDFELVPIEASAGSVLVFDTDVPHKAGHVRKGLERRSIRIDIVCPDYAGTTGKRSILNRIFRAKAVTD